MRFTWGKTQGKTQVFPWGNTWFSSWEWQTPGGKTQGKTWYFRIPGGETRGKTRGKVGIPPGKKQGEFGNPESPPGENPEENPGSETYPGEKPGENPGKYPGENPEVGVNALTHDFPWVSPRGKTQGNPGIFRNLWKAVGLQ